LEFQKIGLNDFPFAGRHYQVLIPGIISFLFISGFLKVHAPACRRPVLPQITAQITQINVHFQ
jgi:hypothetical protein